MQKSKPIWVVVVAAAIFFASLLLLRPTGAVPAKFSFKPSIGNDVPLDIKLTDQSNREVTIKQILNGKPGFILPIFYSCTAVCADELNSIEKILAIETAVSTKKAPDAVVPGRDFQLLVVSMHPKETVELANGKWAKVIQLLSDGYKGSPEQHANLQKDLTAGIHYTIGTTEAVKRLTKSMGIEYTYDPRLNWVNHPAAAAYVTAEGKIVAHHTGPVIATKPMRQAIRAAAKNELEPVGDVMLFGCIKMQATGTTRNVVFLVNTFAVLTVVGMIYGYTRLLKSDPSRDFYTRIESKTEQSENNV
jgi:protein SCO1/2